jgi:FkbM family methyltransferase
LFQIVATGREVGAAAMFEPGLANFKLMVEAYRGRELGFPNYLWPCALGEADESVLFHQDDEVGMASRKSTQGGTSVTSVRLDSVLGGFEPNYIKLDVEGFELSVLKGAINTIKKDRPNLAVCLYHKAEDLWEIPTWLLDNFPEAGYKYYLRQHGQGLDSHCLYAVSDAAKRGQ